MPDTRARMLQVCAVDFTAFHFLRPLFVAARAAGWDVKFACADGPWARALRDEGFDHWPIPIVRSFSPLAHLRAIAALAIRLRGDPPDVVHTHTPIGGMIGRTAAAISGRMAIAHTFHGLPFIAAELSTTERAFLLIERLLARRTARFFSQAAGDAERAIGLGIARRDRMTVIGNGVDVQRFRPDRTDRDLLRTELGIDPDDVAVITVGRLVREKGILELADAAARTSTRARLQVLVVGAALPSDRTPIAEELDRHPVTRSTRTRWRRLGHRGDVERLLRAADIFVLPTHREGLPRSVIEAMATGLPIVASDIPACRELVDREVGILVPVGDGDALSRAIAILADDPATRKAMGSRARDRAVEHHDERRIVRRQIELLRSLVA